MDCTESFACLSADLDGELSVSDAVAVRQHLDGCDMCTRRRRLLEQTRWAARTVRIEDQETAVVGPRGVRHDPGWLAAAAVLAATLGYVTTEYVQHQPPRTSRAADSSARVTPVQTILERAADSKPGVDCGLVNAALCYVDIPCANAECRADVGLVPIHEFGNAASAMFDQ